MGPPEAVLGGKKGAKDSRRPRVSGGVKMKKLKWQISTIKPRIRGERGGEKKTGKGEKGPERFYKVSILHGGRSR